MSSEYHSLPLETLCGKSTNRLWDKVGGELIKVALRKFGDFGDC
tara:strand:+ start:384 stop:515 length:132 start_codon:yes stop_codon:yes gene_type:complete